MNTTLFIAQDHDPGNLKQTVQKIELATILSTGLVLWHTYGLRSLIRYLAGLTLALMTQRIYLAAIIHKTGAQRASQADVLTLSRAATGAFLAGLVISGISDRTGTAGRLSWLTILAAATICDWLDGPLARHLGATQFGSVLDIEADSWLTWWSAVSAVTWGNLPRWCLLPPLLRYLDPLIDWRKGKLPQGGGPWWCRMTGTAQMLLFLIALAPINWRWRKSVLTVAALPVSVGQGITILILLARKMKEKA